MTKKCDGKTVYTCTVIHIEEKGEIKQWHAINKEELIKAVNNSSPDFTFPIDKKTQQWPDECSCPETCTRMVRDTRTIKRQGRRIARRRTGANWQVLEIMKKKIIYSEIEVDYVCVNVKEEKKVSMSFDLDSKKEEKQYSLSDLEKELINDFLVNYVPYPIEQNQGG
jgi:hypothetical protein